MNQLLQKQIEASTRPDGTLDLNSLLNVIEQTYQDVYTGQERALRCAETVAEENKKLNAKLNQTIRRLSEAQRLGAVGDWSFSPQNQAVFLSETAAEICGMPAKEITLSVAEFLEHLQRDEKKYLATLFEKALTSAGIYQEELTLDAKDGNQRTFLLTFRPPSTAFGRESEKFRGTVQDITERKNAQCELERLAFTDPLTKLSNRSKFQTVLHEKMMSGEDAFALLVMDVDNFKDINDLYGHDVGDALLCELANRLVAALPTNCFTARLAGDEFAIIVPKCGGKQCPIDLSTNIRNAIKPAFVTNNHELSVSLSIGIAGYPRHAQSERELFRYADIALYEAKLNGRDQCVVFEAHMRDKKDAELRLIETLKKCLRSNVGLELNYQPQVDVATGLVSGFEALLRWEHPELGNVSPSDFIPLAERSSLIVELGDWVLERAIRQLHDWRKISRRLYRVSVNISASHLQHPHFVARLASLLRQYSVPARQLSIELTESVRADFRETQFLDILQNIKSLGVTLSLDDFGTDYSSLAYLTHLPFDEIKIDKVFIHRADSSRSDRHVLKHIISLTAGLRKRIVAEGAETLRHVELAASSGCTSIQGWYYSKALMPAEVPSKVDEIEAQQNIISAA